MSTLKGISRILCFMHTLSLSLRFGFYARLPPAQSSRHLVLHLLERELCFILRECHVLCGISQYLEECYQLAGKTHPDRLPL